MSFLEFCAGDISQYSFNLGWTFHHQPKPPFSWFAWVIVWDDSASCPGLVCSCKIKQQISGVVIRTILENHTDAQPSKFTLAIVNWDISRGKMFLYLQRWLPSIKICSSRFFCYCRGDSLLLFSFITFLYPK